MPHFVEERITANVVGGIHLQYAILYRYNLYHIIAGEYSQSAPCSQAVTRTAGSCTGSYQDFGGGASERHSFSPQ